MNRFLFPSIVLIVSFFVQALPANAAIIADLRVEGIERIDPEVVLNASGILPGDQMNDNNISEAVKKIYQLGYFSEVAVARDSTENGYVLVFSVTEKSIVERIELLGNKKIKSDELEGKIALKPGSFLDPQYLAQSKDTIRAMYMEKGYFNAQVDDTLIESGSRYAVRFKIEEGKKIRVKKILVSGNQALTDKAVIKAMKTKPRGWTLVWKVIPWFRGGSFNQDTLAQDLDRVTRLYKNHGHLEIAARQDSLSYNQKMDRVNIHLDVTEGPEFRIGRVEFSGNDKINTKRLYRMTELKPEKVFRIDDADKTLENLFSIYTEEGYIYCHIEPFQDLRDSTVDVTYNIIENKPAYINKVIIAGNTKTREKVIRRVLTVKPGELFRRSKVMRSQREIFTLGFFEDVQLNYQPADTMGNIDLIFDVKEKTVGQFQIGTTYGATDGLAGFVQIGVPNFLGRGQQVNLKTEFSNKKFNVDLGFTEPWLFDTPTSVGVNVYHTQYSYSEYTQKKTGGSLSLGRPIPWLDYTRGYWAYSLERINITDMSESFAKAMSTQAFPSISSSTSFTLVRDSRDRPFNASRGTRTVGLAKYAGGILGGRINFQKYLLEYRHYRPLFWKFVGMARAKTGVVDGYTDPATVPPYERFRIGGSGDDGVRGYPDQSINRATYGGRIMLISNLELKYSFTQSVYLLAFADAGNTWTQYDKIHPSVLYKGAGLGVRAEVPMLGVLGLDWGWGFDWDKNVQSDKWQLHFQLGTSF
ncbi:MAG: outer membrane protein assembly factor BamA [Candidatus Edwardsbacteria bacterium]|nr:outer membrane protein assembly factor BamA [Candidatus Edwardsbacteria bacterium]MBU1576048.1 outer membrane protein assembly factor BamA [Candidatus Edwardsbacteria bacterium]MBU2463705.1 outer membrane protein assembly factor BamA [Candidatus Edwardsbacteria bacterium]MBU2594323.1 outer membrane protein assembly factor BamA [Candidatus Edwardsbacteria bacterium]